MKPFGKSREELEELLKMQGHGGNQSLTMHRPAPREELEGLDDSGGPVLTPPKLSEIYTGTGSLSPPRSFRGQPIRQSMRHLASAVSNQYGIKDEVQCYYDRDLNRIVLAANNEKSLRKLREKSGEIQDVVSGDSSWEVKKSNLPTRNPYHSAVIQRHIKKLGTRGIAGINDDTTVEITGTLDKSLDGLHAERRIMYHLRQAKTQPGLTLNPDNLGGIRRPCMTCAAVCFNDHDRRRVRQGAFWPSKMATLLFNPREEGAIRSFVESGETYSYITQFRDDRLGTDCDSESDSDLDKGREGDDSDDGLEENVGSVAMKREKPSGKEDSDDFEEEGETPRSKKPRTDETMRSPSSFSEMMCEDESSASSQAPRMGMSSVMGPSSTFMGSFDMSGFDMGKR